MLHRLLTVFILLMPLSVGAVYFPAGIDWTHPSQNRFVQSLYLNVLGRAPKASETQSAVGNLRRNDNRTARLRLFESLLQSNEYRRAFSQSDASWQVFQAPDRNYGQNNFRYRAAQSAPQGFTAIQRSNRRFSQSVANSIAHYYDAFCYQGEPCIDNPEFARDGLTNRETLTDANGIPQAQHSISNAHACADASTLTTQFKWVAINGTTYPRGTDRQTICLEDSYFKVRQLSLERYDCKTGYTDCRRNNGLDLRANRSGTDNDGNSAFFFRDGSRIAVIQTNQTNNQNSGITKQPSQPATTFTAGPHACADPTQTNSRYTWQSRRGNTKVKGIGSTVVCMQDYYFDVQRRQLQRHNCDRGFTNCRPDPSNNLNATSSTRIEGNPALKFPDGTTLILTSRGATSSNQAPATAPNQSNNTVTRPVTRPSPTTNNNTPQRALNGGACADSKHRLSQFRWKSQGLSSWPDGIDGRIICLDNSYYEITGSTLRNFSCQRNYTNCSANPSKNEIIGSVSQDGTIWTLRNGDEVTLITR